MLELTKNNEALKIRDEDKRNTIDIYEKKFQLLEDENTKMSEEVKELSKVFETPSMTRLLRCDGNS